MRRVFVCLLFCTSLCSMGAFAADPAPLPVFVLAGQSNMVGKRCKIDDLPAEWQKPSPTALFFLDKKKQWVPLEPGKTEKSGFGPEIAFGAAMSETFKGPVGLIKLSLGGTNLAKQWNPDGKKSLYAQLAQQVKDAQKTRPIHIVGMLWVQGGADAKSEDTAKAYAANLKNLIERARKDFGNPAMAFVSGRIPAKSDAVKPHWRLVRAAQQDLKVDGYAWIDCDALTTGRDKIHYDTPGMVNLGKLAAEKMNGLLKAATAPGK